MTSLDERRSAQDEVHASSRTSLRPLCIITGSLAVLILLASAFFYKRHCVQTGSCTKWVLAVGIAAAIGLVIFGLLYAISAKRNIRSEPIIYIAMLLVSALAFSTVFPAGTVPDEPSHYYRAYQFANLIQGVPSNDHSTSMRVTDKEFATTLEKGLSRKSYESMLEQLSASTSGKQNRFYYPLGGSSELSLSMRNLPQLILPSALGISFAQLLGLNGCLTFYMGRLFNLLWFLLLCFLAIRATPIGKPLFAAITLLPMSLHLAGSCSPDVGIIGLSLLFIALCLKSMHSKEPITLRELIALGVGLFLLVPCKVVYAFLALLIFLIPSRRFPDKRSCYLFRGAMILIVVASLAVFSLGDIIYVSGATREADTTSSRLGEEGEPRSILDLFTRPVEFLFVYANTVFEQSSFYLNTFLGGSLGWFQENLIAPSAFMLLYLFILLISAQKNGMDERAISRRTKLIFGIICALIYVGVLSSMYSSWTFRTEFVIQGVQGRYFLPFAPLLLLLFRLKSISIRHDLQPTLMLALFSINAIYLMFILSAAT